MSNSYSDEDLNQMKVKENGDTLNIIAHFYWEEMLP